MDEQTGGQSDGQTDIHNYTVALLLKSIKNRFKFKFI